MTRLSGDGEGCIYYFFRCEVTGSSRQVWKVNGDEKLRLWANSPDKALILVDSLKFLVEEVISADNIASDTTFISYMWFDDPSVFDHNMDVVCESAESESHVSLAGFGMYSTRVFVHCIMCACFNVQQDITFQNFNMSVNQTCIKTTPPN